MYKNIWRLSTLSISHSGGYNDWSIINIFIKLPGKVLQLSYFSYFFTQIPTIDMILWGLRRTLHCVQVDRVWLQVPEQSPGGAGGHQQPALPPDQHLLAAVRCVLNYRFWPWMEGIKYIWHRKMIWCKINIFRRRCGSCRYGRGFVDDLG